MSTVGAILFNVVNSKSTLKLFQNNRLYKCGKPFQCRSTVCSKIERARAYAVESASRSGEIWQQILRRLWSKTIKS